MSTKPKYFKNETTGDAQIQSATVNITDTDNRMVLDKEISGKVTVSSEDFSVKIEIPKKPEPSDMTKLYMGQLSQFAIKRNNKDQKISFVFNKTPDFILAVGKNKLTSEVRDGINKVFEEIGSAN